MEASSAIITVSAIGKNIFPSTPVSVKIGKYTTVIINTPKILGLMTSVVAYAITFKRSSKFNTRYNACCCSPKCLMQFSTIMTAPSTIKPKSRAPKLIKLALILLVTIPVMVNSMDRGITMAVISAARTLPKNKNRMTQTNSAPSSRLFFTVLIVAFTSKVRLYTVTASTPSGSVLLISFILAATRSDTVRLFSPISINTVPKTTSLLFSVAAPVRNSLPNATSATSRIRTGVPSKLAMTIFSMSAMFLTCPGTRIKCCSPLDSM
ncbi:Uncharacterised protein [Legionella pneumophila]|nr:Uncharacterised protein [Legionella pneumophila]